MDQGHTVNQQHKIAPAIGQNRTSRLEHRLLGNLVAALSGGNLPLVVNFQADLFTKVQRVGRVIPLDGYRFAVDKTVEFQWGAQTGDLVQNLLHFAIGQRNIVQPVNIPVILKEDLLPVPDQIFLSFIPQNFRFPAIFFSQ